MVAATVTATNAVAEHNQTDGRFWVMETHNISDGTVQTFYYLAAAGFNYQAAATARALVISASLSGAAVP